MGAKELDVVITVIAVILVIMLWIMLYDSNRFVVRHYSLRDQRIKKSVKAVVLADLHNKRYGKENERLLQAIDEIGPGHDPDRRGYADGEAEGNTGCGGGISYGACKEVSCLLRQRQP